MKTDFELGIKVNKHLIEKGVETPMNPNSNYTHEDKMQIVEKNFKEIMQVLGLDLKDDSLQDTPSRVAKMFVNEIFTGLDYHNFPKCTAVQNKMSYNEMVTVKNISSLSVCEHHFVTIDGKAKISYIPNGKVLGLSKINRIVKFFSRRPQIQERLTEQIFHALSFILETEDIAVMIEGVHYCVKARGVEDDSFTTTTKLGGKFLSPEVRAEFLR